MPPVSLRAPVSSRAPVPSGFRVLSGFLAPVAACVSLAAAGAPAGAQEEPAGPPVTPAAERSIELEGQLQVQAASTSVDDAVTWDEELRRMRLTVLGDAGSGFSGALQLEFGGDRARVRDAFVEYEVSPAVALRAGQFKIPFNGIELTSSKRLLVIERGNRIRGLGADATSTFLDENHLSARNRGVMLTARLLDERLTLQAGGWHGNGEAADENDGKQAAARLEYALLPASEPDDLPLVVGIAAVTNGYFGSPEDSVETPGGGRVVLDGAAYARAVEGWVEYGRYLAPGLHVAGNVIAGDNPELFAVEGDEVDFERFLGLQGWGELLVPAAAGILTGWAPAFRADRFDPDTGAEDDARLLLTPGLNLYFGKNVKAQVNVDVNLPEDGEADTESAFRAQAQVLF